jgi:hypothetical protein
MLVRRWIDRTVPSTPVIVNRGIIQGVWGYAVLRLCGRVKTSFGSKERFDVFRRDVRLDRMARS